MDIKSLEDKKQQQLREIEEVLNLKRKRVQENTEILRKLIEAKFDFSTPYDLENAFIRIEREDLTKIRKILGERLILSFKTPDSMEILKIFIHPESAEGLSFWYLKPYNGKGHCKIEEIETPSTTRSFKALRLVCETS